MLLSVGDMAGCPSGTRRAKPVLATRVPRPEKTPRRSGAFPQQQIAADYGVVVVVVVVDVVPVVPVVSVMDVSVIVVSVVIEVSVVL